LSQGRLQSALQQQANSAETSKLQQQLSITIGEVAVLRAEASASASTIQAHLSTIKQLENRLGASEPSKAGNVAPQSPAPSQMSLAHSEIGKMLEKKQVLAPRAAAAAAVAQPLTRATQSDFLAKKDALIKAADQSVLLANRILSQPNLTVSPFLSTT
jgi:hypothetical protein